METDFKGMFLNSPESGPNIPSSIVSRIAYACTASTECLYRNAVTDPRTGRFDPALERQVALMILS